MDVDIKFWFYLAAVICFLLAAIGENWRYGARTRRGAAPALTLLPLGLALFAFPTMWDVGVRAF
jgi:hypothetical protein